jgi:predicted lipid-binding transport protein (Tim44 family)
MGDGQFLDIILFAMIAAFLVLRLRSVLGRRTGHERPPFDPYTRPEGPAAEAGAKGAKGQDKVVPLPKRGGKSAGEAEQPDRWKGIAKPGSPLARTLSQIADLDPRFDPRRFIEGAKAAYEMIVTAFAAGDRRTLEPLLGREVYDGFLEAIAARESRGETVESNFIGIEKAEILDATLKGTTAQLTIKFVSELISITRSKSGEPVEGDSNAVRQVTDIWTFSRDLPSPDPNWKLVATEAAG